MSDDFKAGKSHGGTGIWRAVGEEKFESNRLEAFSDAVFSIAATLLVLDINIDSTGQGHLWEKIGHQWPSYMAYATSFLTIGGLWMVHHSVFRRVHAVDGVVMRINLILLLVVAFLPFPTHLMAEAIHNRDAERDAVIFYGANLFVISLMLTALVTQIRRHPDELTTDDANEYFESLAGFSAPNLGSYVLLVAAAFIAPRLSAVGLFAIAAYGVARLR